MDKIKSGDTIMVVTPASCCGQPDNAFFRFKVSTVVNEFEHQVMLQCPACKTLLGYKPAVLVGGVSLKTAKCFPLDRVTKVDPHAPLDRVTKVDPHAPLAMLQVKGARDGKY